MKDATYKLLKGFCICFEGIDKSGKSTQAGILGQKLQKLLSIEPLFLREPGGVEISEDIRNILLDIDAKYSMEMSNLTELYLYLAARAQILNELILPTLKENGVILLDRCFGSTFAYQCWAREVIDESAFDMLNALTIQEWQPTLTFMIDITVEERAKRGAHNTLSEDRIESSGDEFYKKVRAGYHKALYKFDNWHLVEGIGTTDSIHQEILKTTLKELTEMKLIKKE